MAPSCVWPLIAACASLTAAALPAAAEADASCPAGGSACLRPEPAGEYYWAHQKGDANRTGLSPHFAPRDLLRGPAWRWVDPHLDVVSQSPLVDDRLNIYISTRGGRVYKFGPDGTQRWMYRTPRGKIGTVPAAMDGRLYANTHSGHVFALDMDTGELVWEVQVANGTGMDSACLLAVNGTVISGTGVVDDMIGGNSLVVALDAEGRQRWTFRLEPFRVYNFQAASPGDGSIVFQDSAGGVYRLRLGDGELLWQSGVKDRHVKLFTTGAAVVGPNGIVYASSNSFEAGVVHAYRLDDGAPVWRRDIKWPANQAVAVGPIAGGGGRLAAVAGVGENPGLPPLAAFFMIGALQATLVCVCLDVCLLKCCTPRRRECGGGLLSVLPWFPLLLCVALAFITDEFSPWELAFIQPAVVNGAKISFLIVAYVQVLVRCAWWHRPPCRPIRFFLLIAACIVGALALAVSIQLLSTFCQGHPKWLWFSKELPSRLLAFDAETGETIWSYTPPAFQRLSSAGDEANLFPRALNLLADPVGDLVCLPDSWSQAVIDASGRVFVGFMDGKMYVVQDEDGDGQIAGTEASSIDFLNSFQGTQAIAPGMLVVVPCGGGMHVFKD